MTSEPEDDPYTENALGFFAPLREVGIKRILNSFVLYLMSVFVVPPLIAYGYAVNIGRSAARGERPPGFEDDGLAADGLSLLSLKLVLGIVVVLPLYFLLQLVFPLLYYLPGSVSTITPLIYVLPLIYLNGAINAVYSAEGTINFKRVFLLSLSLYYLKSNALYLAVVAVAFVFGHFLLQSGILEWLDWGVIILLSLLLATYWIMASFSYRGLVYRNALERGVFEVDRQELEEEWEDESDELRHAGRETKTDTELRPVCPDCGKDITRDASYCNECGAEVVTKEVSRENIEATSNKEHLCGECGEKLRADATFCHVCGSEVGSQPEESHELCDNCGEMLKKGASFCQICGTEVKDELNILERPPDIEYKGAELCTNFDRRKGEITVAVRDPGEATQIQLIVDGEVTHTFSSPSVGDSTTVDKTENQNVGVRITSSGYL